jgi:signal transduction histidine kinase
MDEIVASDSKEEREESGRYLRQNLDKIYSHGSRADSIVKGMLEHTRTVNAVNKYPIDINKMCEQVINQSLEVFQNQWQEFECKLTFDMDPSVGRVEVSASDFTRLLGNLFNNAFYAVNEKQKHASAGLPAGKAGSASNGYEPSVTITSKKDDDGIELSVTDNGNGIPQKVLDKIFQPFFTTKPTGQGTGLGLSLAYDIVKAHGGEIKVATKEGDGTEFIIQMPGSA